MVILDASSCSWCWPPGHVLHVQALSRSPRSGRVVPSCLPCSAAPRYLRDVTEYEDAHVGGDRPSGPAEDPESLEGRFYVGEVGRGLVLLRPAPSGPELMMQVLISGRVAVLEGGCIGIVGGRGGHLVAWPSTTTLDSDRLAIHVPGLGVFRVGDFLRGGGGFGYRSNMALPTAIVPYATREVAVLNEVQRESGQSRADRRRARRA
jgi:hypothetical protein